MNVDIYFVMREKQYDCYDIVSIDEDSHIITDIGVLNHNFIDNSYSYLLYQDVFNSIEDVRNSVKIKMDKIIGVKN